MLATMPRRRKAQPDAVGPIHPLAQWRLRYHVTQEQLSRNCGVSQGQLSKIEHFDQIPIREMLEHLRDYTGLPTDAFVRPLRFLDECPDFMSRTRGPQ